MCNQLFSRCLDLCLVSVWSHPALKIWCGSASRYFNATLSFISTCIFFSHLFVLIPFYLNLLIQLTNDYICPILLLASALALKFTFSWHDMFIHCHFGCHLCALSPYVFPLPFHTYSLKLRYFAEERFCFSLLDSYVF